LKRGGNDLVPLIDKEIKSGFGKRRFDLNVSKEIEESHA
jgi:hypothetical protein